MDANVLADRLANLSDIDSLISTLPIEIVVWGVFYLLVGIFIIYSLLLLYHWIRYGSIYPLTWIMMIVHAGVSFVLISAMFGSAIALT